MDNVEFDEEQYSQTTSSGQKPSKMAAAIIRIGLATDEKGANTILIGLIAVLGVIFLIAVFSGGNNSSSNQPSVPDLDNYPEMEV